ncbi:hypothetical protein FA95DRAFT_1033303 [Auriscalpium vulgare]|uniref:Uncharacterized protein n=1 Tax=Auriscalpium vulgare TaxID=40419 RepID=A0ACB8RWU9_9AGAM|nr:hypothetical protein FA95DRAFT_1033303 [Auriscalpium vulgare]
MMSDCGGTTSGEGMRGRSGDAPRDGIACAGRPTREVSCISSYISVCHFTDGLGEFLRLFKTLICDETRTRKLPKEVAVRRRAAARRATAQGETINSVANPPQGKRRDFNTSTYKMHTFPDYASTIRFFGTTDNYNSQMGEKQHPPSRCTPFGFEDSSSDEDGLGGSGSDGAESGGAGSEDARGEDSGSEDGTGHQEDMRKDDNDESSSSSGSSASDSDSDELDVDAMYDE